ncbi:hypothetical protein NDU88_005838 [Pleurodeles waltl]|uniref:Uncharacterized protein n=1 Tax=Pleurodeles waltl TaxID=8319 RepID=A0AAV7NQ75_PLEWA|nr:hypothetical protein NDU88_005838 [Pleurodeles waltl]
MADGGGPQAGGRVPPDCTEAAPGTGATWNHLRGARAPGDSPVHPLWIGTALTLFLGPLRRGDRIRAWA